MSKVRIYLGEVQTTRKIRKLVLTGEENWVGSKLDSVWRYYIRLSNSMNVALCTHYKWDRTSGGTEDHFYLTDTRYLYIFSSNLSTVADFKAYLAAQYANGTPVTVWYVLATEETGIVNEPLMKIGDYADTLGMEQAGVSIPTANGSTTLDVETAIKPSEVYIKYRGEAVATLSALPAEVSSPEANENEEVNPEETEEEENER